MGFGGLPGFGGVGDASAVEDAAGEVAAHDDGAAGAELGEELGGVVEHAVIAFCGGQVEVDEVAGGGLGGGGLAGEVEGDVAMQADAAAVLVVALPLLLISGLPINAMGRRVSSQKSASQRRADSVRRWALSMIRRR